MSEMVSDDRLEEMARDWEVRADLEQVLGAGPSAGTALAVMTYAALENKTLRNDTVITGTIDYVGNVGAVGGLYEKAKGAAEMGATYFITPVENFYEILLLRNIESEYGMKIIEAKYVTDVIAFMTENRTIEQEELESRTREIIDLDDYEGAAPEFREVAERMVALEEQAVDDIDVNDNETGAVRGFFDNEVKRQTSFIDQGYYFSGANEAFLNYIDLSTINAIIGQDVNLSMKKDSIVGCLSNISNPQKTAMNFEWAVGADLRQQWARERIESTETDAELQDEKFVRYNELMYADAWCHVAQSLLYAAPSGGSPVDESLWEDLAREKIHDARFISTADTASRLAIAEDSYDKGLYGAAIYDAVFVIESEEATINIASMDIGNETAALLEQEPESLWGETYYSHGLFLYELNETEAAYRTLLFAQGLDEATDEMEALQRTEQGDNPFVVVFVATIFLLIILLILLLRRAHEGKRNSKGYGTKQKKRRS